MATSSTPKYTLTYFNIQAAAEKCRLAFVLKEIEFTDTRVSFPEWGKIKPTAKFGKLPLLEFDGQVMSQSDAIMKYIASIPTKGTSGDKLYPLDDAMQRFKIDEVLGLAGDMDSAWAPAIYISMRPHLYGYPEGHNKTEQGKALIKSLRLKFIEETLPQFMKYYEGLLGDNDFICGNDITIADCVLLPQLAKFQAGFLDHVPTDCLDKYPKIIAYLNRLREVPAIKKWYAPKEE
jgi:glutathione S-transferase